MRLSWPGVAGRAAAVLVTVLLVAAWMSARQNIVMVEASTAAALARPDAAPHGVILSERATLHVFLRDGVLGVVMELNFWLRMLQQLNMPIVVHPPTDQAYVSNSLVVCFDASPFADTVAAQLQSGSIRNVGLFHAGDERGFSDTPQKHYRKFSYVLRTYYLPHIFSAAPPLNRHLVWIPNGPRADSGVPVISSSLLPAHARQHLCNCKLCDLTFFSLFFFSPFSHGRHLEQQRGSDDVSPGAEAVAGAAGQSVSPRCGGSVWRSQNAFRICRNCQRLCVYTLRSRPLGRGKHLSAKHSRQFSLFCLCFLSRQTMRFYDALQSGSIPVVLGKPIFLSLLPPAPMPPYVSIASWDDVSSVLSSLRKDRKAIDRMQRAAILYFGEIERDAAARIRTVIDATLQD